MPRHNEYHFFGHPDDMEPAREDTQAAGGRTASAPTPDTAPKKKKGCLSMLGSIPLWIAVGVGVNLLENALRDEEPGPPEPEFHDPGAEVIRDAERRADRAVEAIRLLPPDRTVDLDPTARSLVEMARREATLPGHAFSLDRQVQLVSRDPRIPELDASPPFLLRRRARIEVAARVEAGSFGASAWWWDVSVSRNDLAPAPGVRDLTDPAHLWMRADQVGDAEIFREE